MEIGMATECPYQKGKTTMICEACNLMVPSIEEAADYCESDYRKCPHYRMARSLEPRAAVYSGQSGVVR